MTSARKRTAIFISGRGSNMVSLIAAAAAKSFPAQIALVLSNNADAAGLATAKQSGIATEVIDHRQFDDRETFEAALQDKLVAHNIEFICLAGFMRILTGLFVHHWQGRMINIHPSILPSYKGLHTHERALADGVKLHGCSVHYVVPEMDAGPIIIQAAVPVLDTDTTDTLAARVLEQEHIIYAQALKWAAADTVKIDGQKVAHSQKQTAASKPLINPLQD